MGRAAGERAIYQESSKDNTGDRCHCEFPHWPSGGPAVDETASHRHGRPCATAVRLNLVSGTGTFPTSWPGLARPSTSLLAARKTWMAATRAAMTLCNSQQMLVQLHHISGTGQPWPCAGHPRLSDDANSGFLLVRSERRSNPRCAGDCFAPLAMTAGWHDLGVCESGYWLFSRCMGTQALRHLSRSSITTGLTASTIAAGWSICM
jgi:hypothetical protein